MYISSGGFGAQPLRPEPLTAKSQSTPFVTDNGTGTNIIGALLPLTSDLTDVGSSYRSALNQAMSVITNTPAGWYYRDASGQWQYSAGGTFTPAYQGALLNLSATEILASFDGTDSGQTADRDGGKDG